MVHGAVSAGLQLCSRKSAVGSASYASRANARFGPARCQRPASLGSSRGRGGRGGGAAQHVAHLFTEHSLTKISGYNIELFWIKLNG